MEQILVTRASGEEYLLEDRAKFRMITSISQKTELRSNDTIDVEITSRDYHEFKIGDTFYFLNQKYTLNQLPKCQKNSRNEYQYSATFEGVMYDLRRASYDVNIDTTGSAIYGETLTADLELFAKVLIENANRVFPNKWVLGEFPENTETKDKTFSEEDNCLGVLQSLCDEYDTDFTITTDENGINKINFVQVGQEIPLEFRVGFNQGFYNLTREKVDSSDIVTRLKVYGSDKNLGTSYRSNKLVLPGTNKPNSYIDDKDAIARFGIYEAVKTFDDIYPRRNGKVTSIDTDSPYKFLDSSMDFDLNEKENGNTKYTIPGNDAKIHFNTGALAGYEFNLHTYTHSTKEFHIVKITDENGYEFPSKDNDAFRIAPGDEYVILDIQMPEVYRENAEKELLEKGKEFLADKLEPNVQYSMDIDSLYLQRQLNSTVSDFFKVGDFIKVIDTDFGIDRYIRIKSIERDLTKVADYKLVLSDSKVTNLISGSIPSEIKKINNVIKLNNLNDPAKARRNWRDAQEVLNMVFDVEGDYYTEKIKPNSIETTYLQAGAKSMQFNLIDAYFEPNYQGNANYIRWSDCRLVHFTIEDKVREWKITLGTKELKENVPYYLYARCNKENEIGLIEITETQYTVDQGNYYYFLIGIINSFDADVKARSISLMYGFSTISGRFIKTGRIESSGGGKTFFDLDTGEISGKITFTNDSPAFNQIRDGISVGGENLLSGTENKSDSYRLNPNKIQRYKGQLKDYSFGCDVVVNKYMNVYLCVVGRVAYKNWELLGYKENDITVKGENFRISTVINCDLSKYTKIKAVLKNIDDDSEVISADISRVKLEIGNIPTDWNPSNEDVQEKLTDLENENEQIRKNNQQIVETNKRIENITSFLGTTVDQNVIATGVLMVGSESQSNAGISGLSDNGSKSVRLWAGGTAQNRDKAAWNTLDDGTMQFFHPNGQVAFKFGLENGVFVMNGYNDKGDKLWELSPNRGLVNVAYISESWTKTDMFSFNQSNQTLNENDAISFITKQIHIVQVSDYANYILDSNYQSYEYQNGTHPDNAKYESYIGYKSADKSRTSNIPNGWYGLRTGQITTQYNPSENPDKDPDSNPIKPGLKPINITYTLYYISGGKITKTQSIKFTYN